MATLVRTLALTRRFAGSLRESPPLLSHSPLTHTNTRAHSSLARSLQPTQSTQLRLSPRSYSVTHSLSHPITKSLTDSLTTHSPLISRSPTAWRTQCPRRRWTAACRPARMAGVWAADYDGARRCYCDRCCYQSCHFHCHRHCHRHRHRHRHRRCRCCFRQQQHRTVAAAPCCRHRCCPQRRRAG
jgi:hypothetical protein